MSPLGHQPSPPPTPKHCLHPGGPLTPLHLWAPWVRGTGKKAGPGRQARCAQPLGCRTHLVRHEGGNGAPELVIVSAGVAGPQHHEEEANRHGDLKHGLQEHSLVQPHEGCRRLL